ncbi:hypothetical protein BDB01DRAFT_731864, partial [Pilobolus umbonatus]
EWHTSNSTSAVRYLGYPLYSTDMQLKTYLNEIKVKMIRHSYILRGRHLSVRGSGLVANSLLLSKLYHLLRVIPVPHKWLSEVKAVVRKFVFPFFPATSWTALTSPRKFGGVCLVDLIDQSHALYLIYIKCLLKPIDKADFLSPWVVYCFQHYTGHASILSWFMYPKVYSSLLSSCTSMSHLNKLLLRLPSLVPYDEWSGRWYLDLPLRSILNTTVSSPVLNPFNPPRRYLLSDLYKSLWSNAG